MTAKKIVITGAPGTGKSSIINELIKRGYPCLEEVSRKITIEAQKNGIEQLFLTNPLLFSKQLIKERFKQFLDANTINEPLVFFDRGLHDVLAYMDYIGSNYPQQFTNISKQCKYDYCFILKPWKAIYKNDNQRYEDFNAALKIHNNILKTYQNYNYKLLDVPFDNVKNRVDFIIKTLNM